MEFVGLMLEIMYVFGCSIGNSCKTILGLHCKGVGSAIELGILSTHVLCHEASSVLQLVGKSVHLLLGALLVIPVGFCTYHDSQILMYISCFLVGWHRSAPASLGGKYHDFFFLLFCLQMFRVKDPKVSLDFYSRVMGMS